MTSYYLKKFQRIRISQALGRFCSKRKITLSWEWATSIKVASKMNIKKDLHLSEAETKNSIQEIILSIRDYQLILFDRMWHRNYLFHLKLWKTFHTQVEARWVWRVWNSLCELRKDKPLNNQIQETRTCAKLNSKLLAIIALGEVLEEFVNWHRKVWVFHVS